MIIVTSFKKALISLELALAQPKNEFIRDAVIQRFEYSYELVMAFSESNLPFMVDVIDLNIISKEFY